MKISETPKPMLGIIVALPAEARCISRRAFPFQKPIKLSEGIWVCRSGMGAEYARKATESLIEVGANTLVSFGTAVGLVPELQPGDILLPQAIIHKNQQTRWCSPKLHQNWLAKLSPFNFCHQDRIVDTQILLINPMEKSQLQQSMQAIAADMESFTILETAERFALPALIMRVVIDPIEAIFPNALLKNLNLVGEVHYRKLLQELLRHPSQFLTLLKMARYFRKAQRSLKILATQLIQS